MQDSSLKVLSHKRVYYNLMTTEMLTFIQVIRGPYHPIKFEEKITVKKNNENCMYPSTCFVIMNDIKK